MGWLSLGLVLVLVLVQEGDGKRAGAGFLGLIPSSPSFRKGDSSLPVPKVYFYEQPVDHFNFQSSGDAWSERYLVADDYFLGKGLSFFSFVVGRL
jgi:hypothetical protein